MLILFTRLRSIVRHTQTQMRLASAEPALFSQDRILPVFALVGWTNEGLAHFAYPRPTVSAAVLGAVSIV